MVVLQRGEVMAEDEVGKKVRDLIEEENSRWVL